MSTFAHVPVLLEEVLTSLNPPAGGRVVDLTLGGAGHARAIAARLGPSGHLIGIDQDPDALAAASAALADAPCKVDIVRANFRDFPEALASLGVEPGSLDGLLADLGVSSPQLDRAERGFSLRACGPLDMRMSQEGPSAADLIADSDDLSLAAILRDFGDVPRARAVARAIKQASASHALHTTADLKAVCERALGRPRPGKMHPATLVFQALRIAVNDELGALDTLLSEMVKWLKPGGRAALISFHSGEDRRVKQALRSLEGVCRCPPYLPICGCGKTTYGKALTRKAITASAEELAVNPRASSAKLRAFQKR
jgi:16S rRNA (cytosine1402-N4)-methyltransferase